jgi:hypothetical protein
MPLIQVPTYASNRSLSQSARRGDWTSTSERPVPDERAGVARLAAVSKENIPTGRIDLDRNQTPASVDHPIAADTAQAGPRPRHPTWASWSRHVRTVRWTYVCSKWSVMRHLDHRRIGGRSPTTERPEMRSAARHGQLSLSVASEDLRSAARNGRRSRPWSSGPALRLGERLQHTPRPRGRTPRRLPVRRTAARAPCLNSS